MKKLEIITKSAHSGRGALIEAEAKQMIDEVHSQKLLANFPGEKAPDRQAPMRTLAGLSLIGQEVPQVREFDINPLRVTADIRVYPLLLRKGRLNHWPKCILMLNG